MLSRTEGCQISVTSAPVISSVLEVVERAGLVGQVWQQSWLAKVEELREGKEQRGWLQAWLLMMMGLNGVGDRTEQSGVVPENSGHRFFLTAALYLMNTLI